MSNSKDPIVVCTYLVKRGSERKFLSLLKKHWPTLDRLGVVNAHPRLALRGHDTKRTTCFIEVFSWKKSGFEIAHQHPEVIAIWEPMELLCEARNGRPAMEFPHFERVEL